MLSMLGSGCSDARFSIESLLPYDSRLQQELALQKGTDW